MSSRAMAMSAPGIFLSHPPTQMTASILAPRQTASMESAITSRLTSEHFIPSVPMDIPSLIVIVPNICGMPSDRFISALATSANFPRPALQGVTSLCPFAMPIIGFLKSLSLKPTARSMARLGERLSPWVMARLLRFKAGLASSVMINSSVFYKE